MRNRTVTVRVTAKDIERGQDAIDAGTGLPSEVCAIARAIRRVLKVRKASWGYIDGRAGDVMLTSLDPQKTRHFVVAHDNLSTVKPFDFKLSTRKALPC